MAFTQADVELLEGQIRAAIADGSWRARTVAFADQTVQLNSLKEAQDFLAWLKQQVGVTGNSRSRYAATSKGV